MACLYMCDNKEKSEAWFERRLDHDIMTGHAWSDSMHQAL